MCLHEPPMEVIFLFVFFRNGISVKWASLECTSILTVLKCEWRSQSFCCLALGTGNANHAHSETAIISDSWPWLWHLHPNENVMKAILQYNVRCISFVLSWHKSTKSTWRPSPVSIGFNWCHVSFSFFSILSSSRYSTHSHSHHPSFSSYYLCPLVLAEKISLCFFIWPCNFIFLVWCQLRRHPSG